MGEIIDLKGKRRALLARRGFEGWSRRFPETFDQKTCLKDLSSTTLETLIQPGEESNSILYEFVMGVKGLGHGPRFHFLDAPGKMIVMDITIFLLDQLRFECMRRLGWIEGTFTTLDVPLVDLVEEFSTHFSSYKQYTPELAPSHPRYSEYEATFETDRGAFLRRMIPDAIKAFSEKKQGM